MSSDILDKLTILRREDHFRDWQSLGDRRVCVLCGNNFTGHDVIVVSQGRDWHQLHCPTGGCRSHAHQWVYPGNPSIDENAYADWWKALGDSAQQKVQAV